MRVGNINSVNFGILNRNSIEKRPYGEFFEGTYRGNKIEVFNAYNDHKLLICLYNKLGYFIRCKFRYTSPIK